MFFKKEEDTQELWFSNKKISLIFTIIVIFFFFIWLNIYNFINYFYLNNEILNKEKKINYIITNQIKNEKNWLKFFYSNINYFLLKYSNSNKKKNLNKFLIKEFENKFETKNIIIQYKWKYIIKNFYQKDCLLDKKCIKKDFWDLIIIFWINKINFTKLFIDNVLKKLYYLMILFFILYFFTYSLVKKLTYKIKNNIKYMKNFINNAWHELKTPLTTINFSSQLIEKEIKNINEKIEKIIWDDFFLENWWEKILNELFEIYDKLNMLSWKIEKNIEISNELWKIINWLLEISILDKRKIKEVEKENINLLDFIKKIINKNEIKNKLLNKKIKIEINKIWKENNFTLNINRYHLYTLLKNLLTNATKYNFIWWKIIIEIISNKNWKLILKIKNTWELMKLNEKKYAFDLFKRFKNNSWENWYWLWLFLVKKILDFYWYNINISIDKKNQLNVFTIYF